MNFVLSFWGFLVIYLKNLASFTFHFNTLLTFKSKSRDFHSKFAILHTFKGNKDNDEANEVNIYVDGLIDDIQY
jgi:hypothetical protein